MGRSFLSIKLATAFGILVAVVVIMHPSVRLELLPATAAPESARSHAAGSVDAPRSTLLLQRSLLSTPVLVDAECAGAVRPETDPAEPVEARGA
jgi:hypothetical protein